MARPKAISPKLVELLGVDTTQNLAAALGEQGVRDLSTSISDLAQLGQLNAIRFQAQLWVLWFKQSEQQIEARFEAISEKLDQLLISGEENYLAANSFTAQARGSFDRLSDQVKGLRAERRRARRAALVRRLGKHRRPPPAPIVLVSRSVAAD